MMPGRLGRRTRRHGALAAARSQGHGTEPHLPLPAPFWARSVPNSATSMCRCRSRAFNRCPCLPSTAKSTMERPMKPTTVRVCGSAGVRARTPAHPPGKPGPTPDQAGRTNDRTTSQPVVTKRPGKMRTTRGGIRILRHWPRDKGGDPTNCLTGSTQWKGVGLLAAAASDEDDTFLTQSEYFERHTQTAELASRTVSPVNWGRKRETRGGARERANTTEKEKSGDGNRRCRPPPHSCFCS